MQIYEIICIYKIFKKYSLNNLVLMFFYPMLYEHSFYSRRFIPNKFKEIWIYSLLYYWLPEALYAVS